MNKATANPDPAVDLIRQKLAAIYDGEPDAKQELAQAEQPGISHSKHQRFMRDLHQSDKTMAQIQTAWHEYYRQLPDDEKHQVWQEFYSHSAQSKQASPSLQPHYQPSYDEVADAPAQQATAPAASSTPGNQIYPTPSVNPLYASQAQAPSHSQQEPPHEPHEPPASQQEPPHEPPASQSAQGNGHVLDDHAIKYEDSADKQASTASLRNQIRQTVSRRGKLQTKHHLQSALFGLGFGSLAVLIALFGFFNEIVIAPFIQPSRNVSATPIIVSPDGITASDKNEIIIPKINVQIPLDFAATSTDEKQFEAALDRGVAHYPTTALPGQKGNASFFGHSSNNIFNPGKYKFAFVLLNELTPGDTFYITYNKVVYAYQVYDKKIVEATAIEILNPVPDKQATAMLVTCDPPGTSLRRLAVWGEQVSPNPAGNGQASAPLAGQSQSVNPATSELPGNGPTLWGRIRDFVTGN